MPTEFRDATGKGAAMVGSHARIAGVRRVERVPYAVLPIVSVTNDSTRAHGGDSSLTPDAASNHPGDAVRHGGG